MPDVVAAPLDALDGLPGYPWPARFVTACGIRTAYVDDGEGDPVVFLHGEPTWSFLWRRVLPAVRDAGHRCIAPDLPGFGRSDKPVDVDWYSYDRMTACFIGVLEELDIRGATLVVHDWGGPIGLRAAVEAADRIDRLVILDTGLFTGSQRMSEAWTAFRDFVSRTPDLPIGMLVRGGCHRDPGDEVIAAYEAPFPDAASKAGARALPLLIPLSTDAPGAVEGQRTLEALARDARPRLILWAQDDPVLPLQTGRRFAAALGGEIDHEIPAAGHFLQEDAGEQIGELIAGWLDSVSWAAPAR